VRGAVFGIAVPPNKVPLSGINVRVRGNNNHLYKVESRDAGETAFRNVGDENHYVDILAKDYGCRGFRAQLGSGQNLVGGAIYIRGVDDGEVDFETSKTGELCAGEAIASILIDPIPVDDPFSKNRITKLVLSNLDIAGPERVNEGNVVKIAAVDEVRIENSRLTHRSPRLHTLRIDQGSVKVLPTGAEQLVTSITIQDSSLARSVIFERFHGDRKTEKPVVKSFALTNVTIGDGVVGTDWPDHSIEGLRVWDSFTAVNSTFRNFTQSGIQWRLPTDPPGVDASAAMTVLDSEFNGSKQGMLYALDLTEPPGKVSCSRFTWDTDNVIENALGFEAYYDEDVIRCDPKHVQNAAASSASRTVARNQAPERWNATDLLFAQLSLDRDEPLSAVRRSSVKRR